MTHYKRVISENYFNMATEKAKGYKYSSMNYIDFDDCINAELIHDSDDLILIKDSTKATAMLYFATNNFEALVKKIAKIPGKLRLHFVPRAFVASLSEVGFIEWAEFVDFFNTDLVKTATYLNSTSEVEYLNASDCEEVSAVSKRCKLQSRGFEGETSEWFTQWLCENKVIIQRKNSVIAGYCCVSIYNKGTTLWIREIAVDPKYQRMGLGKKLMEQAIQYGAEKGAVKGFLAADILNENAIILYNKYSFYAKDAEGELQMVMID